MPNGLQMSDYFEIEYVPLPNFEYEEDDFKIKVEQLRTRFQIGTMDSLFVEEEEAQNGVRVPINGLAQYLGDYWSLIKAD